MCYCMYTCTHKFTILLCKYIAIDAVGNHITNLGTSYSVGFDRRNESENANSYQVRGNLEGSCVICK